MALYIPLSQRQGTTKSGGSLDDIMASIAKTESQGNYSAVGPETSSGDRAYGKYQIMGNNLPSWTKEALGYEVDADTFLADPNIQEKVARHYLGRIYDKYGTAEDTASVWFTGRPRSEAGGTVADVTGTSNDEYISRVVSGLGTQSKRLYVPLSERNSQPTSVLSMS